MKLKYIILLLSILSCQPKNEALETALKLAGNNRGELEKVLDHYSQDPTDSLKLKAAEFLIENMPGHYTLEGELINEIRGKIDADTINSYFSKKALDISLSQIDWIQKASRKLEDVEHIKANFLIRHIDLSFKILSRYNWLEDMPFDIFLEYILPYRLENERLNLWRDSLRVPDDILQEFLYKDDIKYTISRTSINLRQSVPEDKTNYQLIRELLHQDIYDDCYHITTEVNFKSRVLGLPSTIDCIPHYANRNGYHYWNTTVSPESKDPEVRNALERKTAKVFRKTYSRNQVPSPDKDEYIPEFFLDPFYKDVSDIYLHTTDVIIRPAKQSQDSLQHSYLCVFNNLTWMPIAIGNSQKSQIEFNNMGKNLVYLPAYYKGKKLHPFNYPFILNLKGNIKYLVPDTCNLQKLLIKRKYPFNGSLYQYNQELSDLVIEASNHSDFQNTDTILSGLETSAITYTQGKIETDKKFRYWRISYPHRMYVAELSFLDDRGNILKGKISPDDTLGFDNNPLTYVYFTRKKKVVVDFNTPTHVSKIICLPQSDGNSIYPGNVYELFYHDLKGWRSLGRQTSTDYFLKYDNVPQGALLWLHNHTTGIEERIFTHEKGKIRFW